ncbi:MAG: hypothetical protein HY516_02215 [Candidatus Aenigmarchaeota archaeon]|nr:hypothetical protein [Candidatus Aenigmarchaeota archaeon]
MSYTLMQLPDGGGTQCVARRPAPVFMLTASTSEKLVSRQVEFLSTPAMPFGQFVVGNGRRPFQFQGGGLYVKLAGEYKHGNPWESRQGMLLCRGFPET